MNQNKISENDLLRLSLIPEEKLERILDVGCGGGELTKKIKERTGAETYGVDVSLKSCELAEEKGIIVKEADLNQTIPFANKFFDLVFAGDVIEHLVNPDIFLRETKRVLKDNGVLILVTPNLASWHNRILLLFGIMPYGLEPSTENIKIGFGVFKKVMKHNPVGHLRAFTLGAIKDLLVYHGFSVEKVIGKSIVSFPSIFKIFSFYAPLSSYLIIKAKKL